MKLSDSPAIMFWKDNPFDYKTFSIEECHPMNCEISGRNWGYSINGDCKTHFKSMKELRDYCDTTYPNWIFVRDGDSEYDIAWKKATIEQKLKDYEDINEDQEIVLSWAKTIDDNWVSVLWQVGGQKASKKAITKAFENFISSQDISKFAGGINAMREWDKDKDNIMPCSEFDKNYQDTDEYWLNVYFWHIAYFLGDSLWMILH